MTEADWLSSPDPHPMLRFLIRQQASERKMRLFAVACARRVWDLLPGDRERGVLDIAQLMADGLAYDQDVQLGRLRASGSLLHALFDPASLAAEDVALAAAVARGGHAETPDYVAERIAQADLLREVFGNPFRPTMIEPSWLIWGQGFVPRMAQGIYHDRTYRRLPMLADALEDAGCDDAELLDHLRGPYAHVRGCWAIDVLLETAVDDSMLS